MVAQVNLLPDSRLVKAKNRRLRQIVISVLIVIIIASIGVPLMLLGIKGGQRLVLNRTQSQIDERKQTLKDTPDITTMLTVKDHLNALPNLYSQRRNASELMTYLQKILPADIRLNNLVIDTSAGTIAMSGSTSSYTSVEKLVKVLQRANVDFDPNKVSTAIGDFSNVTLSAVSGPSGVEVSFTINANYNATLMDGQ